MKVLPDPVLKKFDDQTGLSVFQYMKMGPGRLFYDLVVVKASFEITPDGLSSIPHPGKLCFADVPHNSINTAASSLAQVGDVILGKPGTDIYATGMVRSKNPKLNWITSISLESMGKYVINYQCAVTGPRRWQYSVLSGWKLGAPEITDSVPIQYELAYGGIRADHKIDATLWDQFSVNPSGTGFSFDGWNKNECPIGLQWESDSLFGGYKTDSLTGFGPVARFWEDRRKYAGTYDTLWHKQFSKNVIPDFPPDFDMRFYQCAHPKLQTSTPIRGDERLSLRGVIPIDRASCDINLPGCAIHAFHNQTEATFPIDTIHIDLDKNIINIIWRLQLPHSLNVGELTLELKNKND